MISVTKKIVKQIAAFSILGVCAVSLCTAEPNSSNNAKLIDLMDVMLEDFVNPQQKKEEIIQQKQPGSQNTKKPVAQAVSDPAETLETNNYANALPQTTSPGMPEHLPVVEQYPAATLQPNQALPLPVAPAKQEQPESSTVKTAQIEQRPVVVEHEERFEPVETKEPVQPVKTVIVEPRQEVTQAEEEQPQKVQTVIEEPVVQQAQAAQPVPAELVQPAASQRVEVAAKTVEPVTEEENEEPEAEEIVFDSEILEEEEPYFAPQNFLGGNIEYNSYNTKFKTIGASLMFERAIRPADSIGVIGGGFVSIDSVYKKGQKLSLSSGIMEGEVALFYRHYLMSAAMKEAKPYPYGMFLQPEVGVGVGFNMATKKMIKDQLGLKPSPIVALRTGYRAFVLKSPIYIEPFVRIGYPFVAGGGIGIGLKL